MALLRLKVEESTVRGPHYEQKSKLQILSDLLFLNSNNHRTRKDKPRSQFYTIEIGNIKDKQMLEGN